MIEISGRELKGLRDCAVKVMVILADCNCSQPLMALTGRESRGD